MLEINLGSQSRTYSPAPLYQTDFAPDLVIEVTSICDRACHGCYANNILAKGDKATVAKKFPQLFLKLSDLTSNLHALETSPASLSFRGGEPTRHPELHRILEIASSSTPSKKNYLETHGRWLFNDDNKDLLDAIAKTGTIVKISHDSMHELSTEDLKKITDLLISKDIEFLIAITENSYNEFLKCRNDIAFVQNEKIVFQQKAQFDHELLKPKIGVISCDGTLKKTLNSKIGFKK